MVPFRGRASLPDESAENIHIIRQEISSFTICIRFELILYKQLGTSKHFSTSKCWKKVFLMLWWIFLLFLFQ